MILVLIYLTLSEFLIDFFCCENFFGDLDGLIVVMGGGSSSNSGAGLGGLYGSGFASTL